MYKRILYLVSFALIFASCSSEDSEIIDDVKGDGGYVQTIKIIIDGNCLGCHTDPPTNNAPMPLIALENVKEAIQNRNLIGRIEDGSMPPNGNLSTEEINAIKAWQLGGFKQ